jgi:FixJ family two-component response regulator
VVDDDEAVREATVALLRSHGFVAKAFARADDFLNSNRLSLTTCLIADVKMKVSAVSSFTVDSPRAALRYEQS